MSVRFVVTTLLVTSISSVSVHAMQSPQASPGARQIRHRSPIDVIAEKLEMSPQQLIDALNPLRNLERLAEEKGVDPEQLKSKLQNSRVNRPAVNTPMNRPRQRQMLQRGIHELQQRRTQQWRHRAERRYPRARMRAQMGRNQMPAWQRKPRLNPVPIWRSAPPRLKQRFDTHHHGKYGVRPRERQQKNRHWIQPGWGDMAPPEHDRAPFKRDDAPSEAEISE